MKKVLLAILILIIGIKIITDTGSFATKNSIEKVAEQDEENKDQKEENKHGKRYNEDVFHSYYESVLASDITDASASSFSHYNPYFRFIDKPVTPPPDLF